MLHKEYWELYAYGVYILFKIIYRVTGKVYFSLMFFKIDSRS